MCCASPEIVATIWSNVLLEIGNGGIFLRSAWIAKTLGVEFVDPKSWLDDWDFARDGLRINLRGSSRLQSRWPRWQRKEEGLTSDAERFQ